MARLILNCEGVGLVMRDLGRDIVMIGRSPLNQIVIDHPTVSAQHAVLLKTGASYSLKDLNSANGTRINDILVTDAELKGPRSSDSLRLNARGKTSSAGTKRREAIYRKKFQTRN